MKRSFVADAILLSIAFIWGATFVIVQNAIETLPPNAFNAVRFGIAALFLIGIGMLLRMKFSWRILATGAFIGLWLFGGYALQTMGLQYTSPSKAGFITGLSVVLVPLFSFLIMKEKVKWPTILGVLLAVVGLYLLTLGESLSLNKGDLLVLGCSICFALQIVMTGKFAPQFPALPLAIVQIGTVSLLSGGYAFLMEDWRLALDPTILGSSEVAWGLLITSIPATALAFLAQTSLQKHTTATRVALIFALEPVFAALTSYLWIHEILTIKQILGCGLIFFGMILAELPISAWLKRTRKNHFTDETVGEG